MLTEMFQSAARMASLSAWRTTSKRDGRLWGDGLLEQSLTTTWYPCQWSDVCEDELVFYYPSLAYHRLSSKDAKGLTFLVRQRLGYRIDAIMASRRAHDGPPEHMLKKIEACAVMSSHSSYGAYPVAMSEVGIDHRFGSCFRRTNANERDWWAFELSVLACLDRMLLDLTTNGRSSFAHTLVKPDLPDALVASIHTGINAAYIYPQFAFAYETLGTGAWLGVVMRGRPALMPEFVAEVLAEYLHPAIRSTNKPDCDLGNLIRGYAGLAGGRDKLFRQAQATQRQGRPVIVRRTPSRSGVDDELCIWNEPLADWIRVLCANTQ